MPHEQHGNAWQDISLSFRHFFARKVAFVKYADAYVVLPGGFGTLDELTEALTLMQTGKSRRMPVILVGKAFWSGLLGWIGTQLVNDGMICSSGGGGATAAGACCATAGSMVKPAAQRTATRQPLDQTWDEFMRILL